MRILMIGKNGQISWELNVTDREAAFRFLERVAPTIVTSAARYNGAEGNQE
jgi:hypothetical protein